MSKKEQLACPECAEVLGRASVYCPTYGDENNVTSKLHVACPRCSELLSITISSEPQEWTSECDAAAGAVKREEPPIDFAKHADRLYKLRQRVISKSWTDDRMGKRANQLLHLAQDLFDYGAIEGMNINITKIKELLGD